MRPTDDAFDPLPRPVRTAGGFRNPGRHDDRGLLDVLRWKFAGGAAPWPSTPQAAPRAVPPAPAAGLAVTWIGHSSFLVRTPALTLLLDPVWSEHIGPVGRLGPRRHTAPGMAFDSLPPIDAVVLSHDHYDHCDLPTLRRLARAHPAARLFAPLGFSGLAARAGFSSDRVVLLDWWESRDPAPAPGHVLTATPARHWGNRLRGGRNRRLWCGWHLAAAGTSLFFAGDTAYDASMFGAIRRRLGAPDLALLPIGAYAPRWFMREQHCDPEEAVRIHRELGATRSIGMHWGTFRITDEPRDEPPARLAAALHAAGLEAETFRVIAPGETVIAPPPGP